MNVLSLFDGISSGQVALERAGLKVSNYFASEVKEDAISVTQSNYPNTIQIGDAKKADFGSLGKIDLLMGGSPCQDLSVASKKRVGLGGFKSSLFWEFARALVCAKPTYYLFENVEMSPNDFALICRTLGTYPIKINSELVSAQLRGRYYWTNIGPANYDIFGMRACSIAQPCDKKIMLQDILTSGFTDRQKARCLLESDSRPLATPQRMLYRYYHKNFTTLVFEDLKKKHSCRYLNQTELERCQTLPDGYTRVLDRNRAASCLGDGWTVDVITHILKEIN